MVGLLAAAPLQFRGYSVDREPPSVMGRTLARGGRQIGARSRACARPPPRNAGGQRDGWRARSDLQDAERILHANFIDLMHLGIVRRPPQPVVLARNRRSGTR